jgi:hypothetical protein
VLFVTFPVVLFCPMSKDSKAYSSVIHGGGLAPWILIAAARLIAGCKLEDPVTADSLKEVKELTETFESACDGAATNRCDESGMTAIEKMNARDIAKPRSRCPLPNAFAQL